MANQTIDPVLLDELEEQAELPSEPVSSIVDEAPVSDETHVEIPPEIADELQAETNSTRALVLFVDDGVRQLQEQTGEPIGGEGQDHGDDGEPSGEEEQDHENDGQTGDDSNPFYNDLFEGLGEEDIRNIWKSIQRNAQESQQAVRSILQERSADNNKDFWVDLAIKTSLRVGAVVAANLAKSSDSREEKVFWGTVSDLLNIGENNIDGLRKKLQERKPGTASRQKVDTIQDAKPASETVEEFNFVSKKIDEIVGKNLDDETAIASLSKFLKVSGLENPAQLKNYYLILSLKKGYKLNSGQLGSPAQVDNTEIGQKHEIMRGAVKQLAPNSEMTWLEKIDEGVSAHFDKNEKRISSRVTDILEQRYGATLDEDQLKLAERITKYVTAAYNRHEEKLFEENPAEYINWFRKEHSI